MDRRNFCKIALLAAGTVGLGKLNLNASALPSAVRPGRSLTVLRRACFPDLQALYLDDPECGPCEEFVTGQTFDISGGCPENFCPRAWSAIEQALSQSAICSENNDGERVVIVTCPDGTRPVIFKVEL